MKSKLGLFEFRRTQYFHPCLRLARETPITWKCRVIEGDFIQNLNRYPAGSWPAGNCGTSCWLFRSLPLRSINSRHVPGKTSTLIGSELRNRPTLHSARSAPDDRCALTGSPPLLAAHQDSTLKWTANKTLCSGHRAASPSALRARKTMLMRVSLMAWCARAPRCALTGFHPQAIARWTHLPASPQMRLGLQDQPTPAVPAQ